jgi:Cof subfamily protein (haloacid dehalogenase superfamily)
VLIIFPLYKAEKGCAHMGAFDGILICTDLDGTLLRNDKTISEANKEAIEYFKSEGGFFTFVTGRMPYYVTSFLEKVKPNAPFGCANGGGLYDGAQDKYIWTHKMPENIMEIVSYIDKTVPTVGIQVSTFNKAYFCKENKAMENFRKITNIENLTCHYNDIKEPVSKIIFTLDTQEEIENIEKALREHPLSGQFEYIRSEKSLYEVLPKGISKAASITNLCRYLKLDVAKTVAIGDYYNDIPMFKAAGVGIAVSNACAEALEEADFVTVSNQEDAIAKVIYDIEKGMYL